MFRDTQKALYKFMSSFGIPAYRMKAEQGAEFPYLVYTVEEAEIGEPIPLGFSVYSSDDSYVPIGDIANKISETIPQWGSVEIEGDNGYISIMRGNPFIQDKDDDLVKALYVNLIIMTNWRK